MSDSKIGDPCGICGEETNTDPDYEDACCKSCDEKLCSFCAHQSSSNVENDFFCVECSKGMKLCFICECCVIEEEEEDKENCQVCKKDFCGNCAYSDSVLSVNASKSKHVCIGCAQKIQGKEKLNLKIQAKEIDGELFIFGETWDYRKWFSGHNFIWDKKLKCWKIASRCEIEKYIQLFQNEKHFTMANMNVINDALKKLKIPKESEKSIESEKSEKPVESGKSKDMNH